jgi:polar amino acid transport system substrate-binding protein
MSVLRGCMRRVLAAATIGILLGSEPGGARTLAEVQARGVISQCANPDALPHSSKQADMPGFQIEIGRALANALGVRHEVEWIIPRMRASLVDCDLLFDTIVTPETERGPLKLSHAYQKSGVVLAMRQGSSPLQGLADIEPGQRIGVMINSVASKLLGQRGVRTVPYAFEQDMVTDLAKDELDGCAVSVASIAYYIHAHPGTRLRYVHAYDTEPELRWNLAVGMRRSDDALVNAVNRALDRLIEDGTLARIYANYGVAYRQP